MTVTVSGLNLTVLDACENTTYNDATGTDSVDYKEGSYSAYWTKRSSGDNDCTFTPSSSVDMSGTGVHVRWWGLFVQGSLINLEANGGIQFWCTDGINTGYWYVSGRDTYPGGWYNFVVDVSAGVDSGTKPTNMNAITDFGVRINLTAAGKNFANTWIDNFTICDGLIAYGDDGGSSFDFEDIYSADNATTLGIGIIQKFGGIYYLTGKLQIGDSAGTNSCDFNPISQTVIFENRLVLSTLYKIEVIDNGTGITDFQMGTKVGSSGVSGCTVGVEDLSQTPLWNFDADDIDIDYFKLYGCTFFGASSITFPSTATNIEILNTNFQSNGLIYVNTSVITNCNFINAVGTGAIHINSTSHQVTYCNFINNTYAVLMDTANTYTYSGLIFSGNTTDINNTSGGSIIISATNSSNPSTYTGSVTINNAVDLNIYVKDKDNVVIQTAQVAIYKTSDNTQLMNEDTDVNGLATETFNYLTNTDIYFRIRKSSIGTTRYVPVKGLGQITSSGFTVTVILYEDINII